MKAIHLTAYGNPSQSLMVVEVSEPNAPSAGEALVHFANQRNIQTGPGQRSNRTLPAWWQGSVGLRSSKSSSLISIKTTNKEQQIIGQRNKRYENEIKRSARPRRARRWLKLVESHPML